MVLFIYFPAMFEPPRTQNANQFRGRGFPAATFETSGEELFVAGGFPVNIHLESVGIHFLFMVHPAIS